MCAAYRGVNRQRLAMWEISHPSKTKITPFFEETLGAKLKNLNWSLGAIDSSNRVFLKVWADCIEKNRVRIYWKDDTLDRKGKNERLEHLKRIYNGAKCFGILCKMINLDSGKRKMENFECKQLLRLGDFDDLIKRGNVISAGILGWFPISKLKILAPNRRGLQNSTVDDIPVGPIGCKVPGRTSIVSYRYERDEKIRRLVIKQARGVCEYCGELGFLLPDGSHYLEAHHIIALANQGPDTVDNVIALCPSDHREAHYGAKAVEMENKMIEIIKRRTGTK
jgi:5-methylcytosine-specific restriction protein A